MEVLGGYGEDHILRTRKFIGSWGKIHEYGEQELIYDPPEWICELLRKRGVDVADERSPSSGFVLCVQCSDKQITADWELWGEVLEEVFMSYRQRIAEGQVCTSCFSDRVEGHCGVCGRAYCSSCRYYVLLVCEKRHTRSNTTPKPAGCAGALLAIVFACAMAGLGLWVTLS